MSTRAWTLLGIAAAVLGAWAYWRTRRGEPVLPASASDVADAVSTFVGDTVGKVSSSIRGIRNNNPTNMKDSGVHWQGVTGVDDRGFLQFDTMANGIRAATINLRNYGRLHGIDTVDALARRWSTTDQDAYSANLAAYLGVDAHETIDLEDPGTLTLLVQGIVRQEDGAAAELLVDNQIAQAVANV